MEFNILIGDGIIEEVDWPLFFNPMPMEKFIRLEPQARFPHLMRQLGIFPSASQAIKAGWDKDIPEGLSHWVIGKGKSTRKDIWILKISKIDSEFGR
jgi:hypothetical protein